MSYNLVGLQLIMKVFFFQVAAARNTLFLSNTVKHVSSPSLTSVRAFITDCASPFCLSISSCTLLAYVIDFFIHTFVIVTLEIAWLRLVFTELCRYWLPEQVSTFASIRVAPDLSLSSQLSSNHLKCLVMDIPYYFFHQLFPTLTKKLFYTEIFKTKTMEPSSLT